MTYEIWLTRLGERLRQAAESAGMTQEDIARQIGIGYRTGMVSRWWNAKAEITLYTLILYAKATDRSVSWFLQADEQELDLEARVEELENWRQDCEEREG